MSRWSWLRVRYKQICYRTLAHVFGFDRWHCRVVRENCGYFAQLRQLHEAIRPATTVEVGCGLGEIISGLRGDLRIGIDREAAVIKAARFIRGRDVRFLVAGEPATTRIVVAGNGTACLVFVNWFHAYAAADLQPIVGRYVEATGARHVIFDIIKPAATCYRHHHPAALLERFGQVNSVVDAGDRIRNLVVMAVRSAA